jgi:hypothetical protein
MSFYISDNSRQNDETQGGKQEMKAGSVYLFTAGVSVKNSVLMYFLFIAGVWRKVKEFSILSWLRGNICNKRILKLYMHT